MPSPTTLPLSDIIDIIVTVVSGGASGPDFNVGMILDNTGAIPIVGTSPRIRLYTAGSWSTAMITDGFTTASDAYLKAGLYFSSVSQPQNLYVGSKDISVGGVSSVTIAAGGTGYSVAETLTLATSSATYKVTAVDSVGAVIDGYLLTSGSGGSVSIVSGVATTASAAGSGCTLYVNAVGPETYVQALAACRAAQYNWFGLCCVGATDSDKALIEAWAQSAAPDAQYFLHSASPTVAGGVTGNLFATSYAASYSKTCGIYSTQQGGTAPNNAHAAAAMMGLAMGLNTALANSAFTLDNKTLVGIIPEPVSETQLSYIDSVGGNVYVNRQNAYNVVNHGRVFAPNTFYDQILYRAYLSSLIQYNVMNVLTSSPKVAQTDAGQQRLIHAVDQAAQQMVDMGYIAPGTWTGQTILGISDGTVLPMGFLCQSQPYTSQSSGDRAARNAMPIYLCLIEAGAVQSIVIQVLAQI
jgi:hypothetical protein